MFCFAVQVSELALVRFIVKDYRGKLATPEFVCEATLPLDSLREGYRHVRLSSAGGEPLNGICIEDFHLLAQRLL